MDPYGDDRALGSILESLPEPVVAALEVRDAWRRELADNTVALEFIVSDLARWPLGSVVRVAFLDGDKALHADIVSATAQISEVTNLTLDFGVDLGHARLHQLCSGDYRCARVCHRLH